MLSKLSKATVLIGMGINGAFYLAWFLSSGPDRLGYWYLIYFLVFPCLFILGLLALAAHDTLRLSKWVGGTVLIYVGSLTLLLMGSGLRLFPFLDWLPQGSFEVFHVMAWGGAVAGLCVAMSRR